MPAYPVVSAGRPDASVVVVTRDNLTFLRLSLKSVFAGTKRPFELIVVDDGFSDRDGGIHRPTHHATRTYG